MVINQKVVVIAATTSASRPAGDPTFFFYHQIDLTSRLDPLGIEKERNIPPPLDLVDDIYQNDCIDSGTARHFALLPCTEFILNQAPGSRSDNVGRATRTRKSASPRMLDDFSAYRMSF